LILTITLEIPGALHHRSHPAHAGIMGDKHGILKTLVIPALISLALFVTFTYAFIPLYRRYRARYAQYLPIDSISSTTLSLRDRITARIATFANRREDRHLSEGARAIDHRDESIDAAEELNDVDDHMRLVIESHARSNSNRPDNTRRLSRELEEGFRDDSDDEPDRR
jgi:hypothetical protein